MIIHADVSNNCKMNDTLYKYKKPKDIIFYQILFFTIIIIYGYNIVRELFSLIEVFSLKRLILLLVMSLTISCIVYIITQIIFMRKEYNKLDWGKEVILKPNELQLLIKQDDVEKLINNKEIFSTEVYESWVSAYPLGYFSFIRLNLTSGENITITGFTLPGLESDISEVLKGTKIIRHRRFINRINNNYC
jgi:cytochrome b subunit of formate dehydrogenase